MSTISKEVIRRYVDREGWPNGAFANTAPSVSSNPENAASAKRVRIS